MDELGAVTVNGTFESGGETLLAVAVVVVALLVDVRWTSFGARAVIFFLARSAYDNREGAAIDVKEVAVP